MKRALVFLLFILAIPLRAQELHLLERVTVAGARGGVSWPVAIRAQAVGFVLHRAHQRVTVSARLGNGGGHAYVDAYLMRQIGPGATMEHEIAYTTFDLAYPFDEWVDLFTDLDLDAGQYWLVIAKPRDVSHSSINWFVAQPLESTGSCSANVLSSRAYTFHFDEAEYIPASKFEKKFEPYRFQFEVTELRTAGSSACP